MSVIVKPHGDFEANTTAESAKVNDQINTIYTDHNGGITDANIAAAAEIQQSKIASLTADLTALQNRKGWELISSVSANNQATVDFTGITANYAKYEIEITNLIPSVLDSALVLRVSSNGVVQTGSYKHSHIGAAEPTLLTPNWISTPSAGGIVLAENIGIDGLHATITSFAPGNATVVKQFFWNLTYMGFSTLGLTLIIGNGLWADPNAIDGLQLLMYTGLIQSGECLLYGLKK